MSKIKVKAEKNYTVAIDENWVHQLKPFLEVRTRVAVIVSKRFHPDLSALNDIDAELHFFEVADGEKGKSTETLIRLWDWLGAAGFTRSDLIIGIGGGAVTDLAGFVAATWLRGIDWIAIPTSLAGMVDASVGGKTGINSDYGKNLIGSFHSPIAVLIDSSWVKTLSDRDFSAGMAEVIKCGFIADPTILSVARKHTVDSLRADSKALEALISRAVQVKANVVSIDFKESFEREALNYGHTLGHAIEMYSKYKLRHGEAVAIGLVFAAELAKARGFLSSDDVATHRTVLSQFQLPTSFEKDAWEKLRPLMALDKKSRGNTLRFVALNGIGATVRFEDLTSEELDAAYERISS